MQGTGRVSGVEARTHCDVGFGEFLDDLLFHGDAMLFSGTVGIPGRGEVNAGDCLVSHCAHVNHDFRHTERRSVKLGLDKACSPFDREHDVLPQQLEGDFGLGLDVGEGLSAPVKGKDDAISCLDEKPRDHRGIGKSCAIDGREHGKRAVGLDVAELIARKSGGRGRFILRGQGRCSRVAARSSSCVGRSHGRLARAKERRGRDRKPLRR